MTFRCVLKLVLKCVLEAVFLKRPLFSDFYIVNDTRALTFESLRRVCGSDLSEPLSDDMAARVANVLLMCC